MKNANDWTEGIKAPAPLCLDPADSAFGKNLERFHRNKLFLGIRQGQLHLGLDKPDYMANLKRLADADCNLDVDTPRQGMTATEVLVTLVSDEGGPSEIVDDGETGLVLPGGDGNAWAEAIVNLLEDGALRHRLALGAKDRTWRYTLTHCFESFWSVHERAAAGPLTAAEIEAPVGGMFARMGAK